MSPRYKLTYFNARALAEPIRLIFAHAGVEFEDVRFDKSEWPGEFKEAAPFGKVPFLEVDDKKIHQSLAICRYLAKQYNLNGENDWQAMEIDIIVDTFGDMKQQGADYFRLVLYTEGEVDEKMKEQLKQVLIKETLPYYFNRFDAIIKENGGFFVGGKLTWADIFWSANVESLVALLGEEIFKDFPSLIGLQKRVYAQPGIREWIEKRPQTFL